MPKELDLPHWAIESVQKAREYHKLSDKVTDRMIYARLMSITASRPIVVIENPRVKDLENEVRDG